MDMWRFMREQPGRCRRAAIGVWLIASWAGCAVAPSSLTPAGTAAVEPSSATAPAGGALGDYQPEVATEPEQRTEGLAVMIDGADAAEAMRVEPAVLHAQSDVYYWTGGGPGSDLAAFGSDDQRRGVLLAAAATRPIPGDRETCNIRDDRPGPKAIWAACGNNVDQHKAVRHWFRAASRFPAQHFGCGRATLLCGHPETEKGKGDDTGFFHIQRRHSGDWEAIGAYDNVNWRTAADWGMWNVLKYPSKTTYQADRDTWLYEGPIYLKDLRTGKVVKQGIVSVALKPKTKNIVTAWPHDLKKWRD